MKVKKAIIDDLIKTFRIICSECDREIKEIGDSGRRGDQRKTDTLRFIKDCSLIQIKNLHSQKYDKIDIRTEEDKKWD